jgi:sec-independent protein translocase protein TatA
MFGLSELAIILIVVIAVLAAKRLPELTRSAGKSARILKAEARAAKEEQSADGGTDAPRVIQGEAVRAADSAPTTTDRTHTPETERS